MKILKNGIPLHKLYGFPLLNTSLIVFTPIMLFLTRILEFEEIKSISAEYVICFILSSGGIILSLLFIMRKKIAVYLLTILLIVTIMILLGFMFNILLTKSVSSLTDIIFIVNAFGFFIIEGILGLMIIHSKKLSDEFDQYN